MLPEKRSNRLEPLFNDPFTMVDTLFNFPKFPAFPTFEYIRPHRSIDFETQDNHYVVSLDLPGVPKDLINIEVSDKTLTILVNTKKADKISRIENFMQAISLPRDSDVSGINAEYKDGVLSINIPRSKPDVKKITIN